MGEKYCGSSSYLWRFSHFPLFCDHQDTGWRQTVDWKQLCATLEDILEAAGPRRCEPGRRGEGGRGREIIDSDAGSNGPWYDET